MTRSFGRGAGDLRPVRFKRGYTRHAEGSVLVEMGDTVVLCTASVEEKVPPFLKGKASGWVTAEYGMLPRATHTRGGREAATGKQSGRTQEIQRLIGRSLRTVTDLARLGERQVTIDCDVLQADGGTRTARHERRHDGLGRIRRDSGHRRALTLLARRDVAAPRPCRQRYRAAHFGPALRSRKKH